MICAGCQHDVPDGQRFCPHCGASLALINRTLNQRYQLLAKLGEGGFGSVYRARQIAMERDVAVKILHANMSINPQIVSRFRREAQAASNLRNAHTIVTHDFDQTEDGLLYIVTELLEGQSLYSVLQKGALSPKRAAAIAEQICESLAEAHAHGIVHRDIKAENIFLETRDGAGDFVKVLDFGIAKIVEGEDSAERLTQAGQTLGTLEYMAPEQLEGETLDGRADLYALGVLLYQMLSGSLPFAGKTAASLITAHLNETPPPLMGIPAALQAAVARTLSKNPADRPQTALDLRKELGAALPVYSSASRGFTAAAVAKSFPSFAFTQEIRTVRPKRVAIVSVISIAVVCAVAAGFWFWFRNQPAEQQAMFMSRVVPTRQPATTPLESEPAIGFAHELLPNVPAELTTVLSLDLATLRQSSLGSELDWLLSPDARSAAERFASELGVPLEFIDRLVLATTETPSLEHPHLPAPGGSSKSFFVSLQGRFLPGLVEKHFAKRVHGHHFERDRESGITYIHAQNGHIGFLPNGTLFATGGNPMQQVLKVLKGTRTGLIATADALPLLARVGFQPQRPGLAMVGTTLFSLTDGQAFAQRLGVRSQIRGLGTSVSIQGRDVVILVALRADDAGALCQVAPTKLRAHAGLISAFDSVASLVNKQVDRDFCLLSLSLGEADIRKLKGATAL